MQTYYNFAIHRTVNLQNSWFLYLFEFNQVNSLLMNRYILTTNHTQQGLGGYLQQKSTSLSTEIVDKSLNINVAAG